MEARIALKVGAGLLLLGACLAAAGVVGSLAKGAFGAQIAIIAAGIPLALLARIALQKLD